MTENAKSLFKRLGEAIGSVRSGRAHRRTYLVLLTAALLVFAALPFVVGNYWTRVLTGIFMFVTLSEAWNVITGYTGYFAFGNIAFFGVGAYVTAVLVVKFSMPVFVAILIGGIIAAIYATLLGFPLLRLTGHYFSIATIGVNLATREIAFNLPALTGGGMGITMPLMRVSIGTFYRIIYFSMFALMVICIVAVYYLIRSRIGFALRAIGADEQAARSMGINTTVYKVLAWSFSAFFFGLVGGLYAYWFSFIEPPMVFNPADAIKIVAMTYLGGIGTIPGPIIGAFILEIVSEAVWGQFLELHLAVLGIIIIFVTVFMPDGLMPLIRGELTLRGMIKNVRDSRL
jgi:branched-chain amino acid transport system permease protein